MKNVVMSITSLEGMKIENRNFLVVGTQNPVELPNHVANLMDPTTTRFLPKFNPDNIMDLEEKDVILAILIYGDLDQNLFTLPGRTQILIMDKHILDKIETMIVDAAIIGGKNSPIGPKIIMKKYLK